MLIAPGNWAATDPFLLQAEDWYPRGVFAPHPHRSIETVTYVIDGAVEHYDNHGNAGVIGPGETLWMTTGRGVVHNELPPEGQSVHLLQLWINLPRSAKLMPMRYQELRPGDLPVLRQPGVEAIVFSGSSGGLASPTVNEVPVTMVEVRIEPGAGFEQELQAGHNAFVVVISGDGAIGDTPVRAGDVAWLDRCDDVSEVRLSGGDEALRAILFAGRPLREPVASRGPFVMNTELELDEAYGEFRAKGERFGMT